jgi:hypothetical protein
VETASELKQTGTPYTNFWMCRRYLLAYFTQGVRKGPQPSSKESRKEDTSQAEQNKRRKRDRNSDDEFCTKK